MRRTKLAALSTSLIIAVITAPTVWAAPPGAERGIVIVSGKPGADQKGIIIVGTKPGAAEKGIIIVSGKPEVCKQIGQYVKRLPKKKKEELRRQIDQIKRLRLAGKNVRPQLATLRRSFPALMKLANLQVGKDGGVAKKVDVSAKFVIEIKF